MKLLKWIFIIGCIPLVLGDAFIVINAVAGPILPYPVVAVLILLGIVGIFAGIVYCKPQKEQ
ncbi:MAG: hypothetical protein IJY16_02675 [Clostridia bacterium]|nr:hypothetical protein [Clostridia bacterium]